MTIPDLLRRQDGLITREQALTAGLTPRSVEHRVVRGEWLPVRPRVFLSAAHAMTDRARIRADLLWLGADAVLTGLGAAWWWRLTDEPPRTVRVAVPSTRRVRPRDGTIPERRDLPAARRVAVDGLTVTTRALTVVDAACELGVAAGAELMDRALLRGRVDLDGLRDAHRLVLGRRGVAAVAALLPLAAGGARFAAERRLHAELREQGVGGWVANHPVVLPGHGTALLDLAFLTERVVVEIDGWAHHRDPEAFRCDRRRQNALVLAGWTVLRVTWHDLVAAPHRVLAGIAAARSDDRGDRSGNHVRCG